MYLHLFDPVPSIYETVMNMTCMMSFFSCVESARKVSSDWSQKTMTHVIFSIVSVLFGVTFPFRAAR